MRDHLTLRGFFQEHFLGFIGGIFAAYVSIALAVVLAFVSYFRLMPPGGDRYLLLAGAVLTLLVVHGNLMVLWGRPRWVWLLAGVFALCLGFVLPTIQYAPHLGMYGLAVLAPLLGLLLLRSRRQQVMRDKLVLIRHQREALNKARRSAP